MLLTLNDPYRSLERLEAELSALDQQEEALNSDSDIPEEDPEEETEKEKPVVEMVNKPRAKSPSTFSSDSEEVSILEFDFCTQVI